MQTLSLMRAIEIVPVNQRCKPAEINQPAGDGLVGSGNIPALKDFTQIVQRLQDREVLRRCRSKQQGDRFRSIICAA